MAVSSLFLFGFFCFFGAAFTFAPANSRFFVTSLCKAQLHFCACENFTAVQLHCAKHNFTLYSTLILPRLYLVYTMKNITVIAISESVQDTI